MDFPYLEIPIVVKGNNNLKSDFIYFAYLFDPSFNSYGLGFSKCHIHNVLNKLNERNTVWNGYVLYVSETTSDYKL